MIRVARMAIATALLSFVLVPAQGAKKEWREAIVQEVQRHGRPGSRDEVVDYAVVDETAEYVLRPHSASLTLKFFPEWEGCRTFTTAFP